MSIKDELKHVKDELSGDEKILESAFKLERFYKKNKLLIWGIGILLLVGFGGSAAWGAYQQSKLNTANDAYLTLEKDSTNSSALDSLKNNNPKLYELFQLKQAKTADDVRKFETSSDPIISSIAKYRAGALENKVVDTEYYHDMAVVEEAYLNLKSGNKKEAKNKLSLIAKDSPVAKIAQLLEHYAIDLK